LQTPQQDAAVDATVRRPPDDETTLLADWNHHIRQDNRGRPMKLSALMVVNAIVAIVFGLAFPLAPGQVTSLCWPASAYPTNHLSD
jgi:hypothetical protein